MRTFLLLAILSCTTLLHAQTSGRTFRRDARTPATPAASTAVEASASTKAPAPLQKLRSGRAWPRYHHGRLPQPQVAKATTVPTDASSRPAAASVRPVDKRGFWRQRR
jgi:hypothetical protein